MKLNLRTLTICVVALILLLTLWVTLHRNVDKRPPVIETKTVTEFVTIQKPCEPTTVEKVVERFVEKPKKSKSYSSFKSSKCYTINCYMKNFGSFFEEFNKDQQKNFFKEQVGNRNPLAPFITGDLFRFLATWVCDNPSCDIPFKEMKDGDLVFVKTDFLSHFFSNLFPKITSRFILLSHNSDYHPDPKYFSYLSDPKFMKWFTQNLKTSDNSVWVNRKLFNIPIGLNNRYNPNSEIEPIVSSIKPTNKDKLVLMSFSIDTNPSERQPVYDKFSKLDWVSKVSGLSRSELYSTIARHKFVISPRGNGIDCHRTWESLYLGTIPILKHSKELELFQETFTDLPVLIIDDWEIVTEDFLNRKYEELSKQSYSWDKLFVQYWANRTRV